MKRKFTFVQISKVRRTAKKGEWYLDEGRTTYIFNKWEFRSASAGKYYIFSLHLDVDLRKK